MMGKWGKSIALKALFIVIQFAMLAFWALKPGQMPVVTLLFGVLFGLTIAYVTSWVAERLQGGKEQSFHRLARSESLIVKLLPLGLVAILCVVYLIIQTGWFGVQLTLTFGIPGIMLFLALGGRAHARKFYKSLFGKS